MSDITPSPELAAIVRRWLRSYAAGDKEAVVNLFSDDAALGYIGSSHGEIWHDDTLRRGMPVYMDDIPSFTWGQDDFRGFECGTLGWVEWFGESVFLASGKEITFRSTFVLHLEKGVWRIVHVHNSNPVANMDALGYESRGIEELLKAALSTPVDLAQTGMATIMFTDIAGSSALAETLGDARWSAAVQAHMKQVGDILEGHGGTLVKTLGDGTMSAFPSATAALTAASDLQQIISNSTAEPRLQIRIGLHTGDLVEQDGDMFGTVVNKAARVASIAAPGDICLSDATHIMVGGAPQFRFSDPAQVHLKGLEGQHTTYRLEWRG
ncbi:nuclear transport factor 2 family protein [Tropicibacter sp. R16_0]|uniref:adenylate/guanylate cyclase domain-containing protein n=1 Tax=Tropicibacter sp. R16_0 TaxID=2821102 RepID=UPI001AD9D53F|nr:adenylate/guanylate cyclase domain-containing protein [Tropicibacter sp. R16_0]MBO9449248.1 nuclear transport factor 2 family protein [Tropicibacter sp. R16_0]